MLTAQRGAWLDTFTYDGANRVTQTVQNGRTISYSYNIPGRTRMVTYPSTLAIVEHTDARSRLGRIDDGLSPPPIVQYTYDLGNRVTTRAYRNGTVATYGYNADNWIVGLDHSIGVAHIATFAYDFDNEGNKKFEQKLTDLGHSEAYQYDNAYRLINYQVGTLVGATVPVPSTQTAYSLDPVGNWNSKTTDAVSQNRVHDAVNELVKIDAANISYDANGNLQNDTSYSYAYDEESRLTSVTRLSDSAVVGQYQYDALGRRTQKIANPAGTASTTRYFYDDARIVEEQDAVGTTLATYTYGNYIDEVLTMNRGGQTTYYHQNSLWSVAALTGAGGTTIESYRYDAYGQPTILDGLGAPVPPNAWGTPHSAAANPWLFTGRQLDEEAGLYFYRARSYDAGKGRFAQRDPKEYVDSANLYQYVQDRPTARVDPTGEAANVPYLCCVLCILPPGAGLCTGTCSCTGNTLATQLIAQGACCEPACRVGCARPAAQPGAMAACVQRLERIFWGPAVTCTCT
jgi:RHS repeat-associated protein